MRPSVLLATAMSLCACSPAALTLIEHDGDLAELSHEVTVHPDGASARLQVTRQLRNESDAYQSYEALLSLPAGAIATGLRVASDGRWQPPPRLASAEETTIRWDALTELGDGAPVTLGLLNWSSRDEGVELKLFSVAPGETVTVEYTLELPRDYEAGVLRFDYPRAGVRPVFHLADAPGMTVEPVLLADDAEVSRLEQRWSPSSPTEARWATYPLGVDRHLWRLELDVAAQLSTAPVRPNVVFLVDASHSQGPAGIANQLVLIAPFLANAPDAQVEVVLYRRHAERLFGRFVAAPEVPALLQSIPPERLVPANGSNVDEAAALTAELLSGVSGPGRVILFTDGRLRYGLTSEVVNAALRPLSPDVVVHVVRRTDFAYGPLELQRHDEATELTQVASAHGGISAVADGLPEEGSPTVLPERVRGAHPVLPERSRGAMESSPPVLPERSRGALMLSHPVLPERSRGALMLSHPVLPERSRGADALLGLLRPVSLDEVTLEGEGFDAEAFTVNSTLSEGSATRVMSIHATAPTTLLLKGRLWAREYEQRITIDEKLADRLPGLALGHAELRHELEDDELRTAAFASNAVSPLTSFLSAPDVAAPAITGLPDDGRRCMGLRTFSMGSSCGGSRCSLRSRHKEPLVPRLKALLADSVAQCRAAHGASPVQLMIEVTRDEVVAARATSASPALAGCVTEAAWALRLGPAFNVDTTWDLEL